MQYILIIFCLIYQGLHVPCTTLSILYMSLLCNNSIFEMKKLRLEVWVPAQVIPLWVTVTAVTSSSGSRAQASYLFNHYTVHVELFTFKVPWGIYILEQPVILSVSNLLQ